jgi:hypothetical protein
LEQSSGTPKVKVEKVQIIFDESLAQKLSPATMSFLPASDCRVSGKVDPNDATMPQGVRKSYLL